MRAAWLARLRWGGFVLAVLAAAVGAAASAAGQEGEEQPRLNFVIVHVDDLGWADVGCYGSDYYDTPNIDALADRGVRFTDAYAAAAICSPTRAALLTGRYPARLGITDWIRATFQGGQMPADGQNPDGWVDNPQHALLVPENPLWLEHDEITIAEALKPLGYTSAHIGKWHLGMEGYYPEDQGFDVNIGGCDFGQPPSFFDPYTRPALPEGIPTLEPRREGEYLVDREADEAARFIAEQGDEPFFLHFATYGVHTPIQAKRELIEKYQAIEPPGRQIDPIYAAMVQSVDEAVGTIVAALDEAGVADRTVIIFTSDNGGLMGHTSNHPQRSGKGYPYEGGIRVPMIVAWPGVTDEGRVSHEPVISMDVFTTVLDLAGAEPPTDRAIDGLSLGPIVRGEAERLDRDQLIWHFPHYRHEGFSPYSIIRQGDWKLIQFYDPPRLELFNLAIDGGESTNYLRTHRDKARQLRNDLQAELRQMNARLPREK